MNKQAPWWRRLFSSPVPAERLGHWSDRKLRQYTELAAGIAGDMTEIGVAYGETFKRLVPIARSQGKRAHAFDSFEGMSAPTEKDRQEGGHPQGQFNVGGVEAFRRILDAEQLRPEDYRLWSGFIPACFEDYVGTRLFSFVIVDVDHYTPTRDALIWIWPLVPNGGIVLCDDYVKGWQMESSLAIDEFLAGRDDFEILEDSNHQLSLRKTR